MHFGLSPEHKQIRDIKILVILRTKLLHERQNFDTFSDTRRLQ